MQDDLTDTVKTLVKSGYLDQNKLCIVGLSYGGYAALAGATFTPNLYRCAISINGVADVERMMRDERRERSAEHWVYEYWQKVITDGTFQQQHLKTISPINYVENVQIPILLIHGEHDEVVPEHQSEYMYEELKDADKTVTFISLDDGDHYLSSAKNRMQALNAVDSFLAEYL
jgi:dipeptidyl aminopeptidase/acylaminoacyl peptidase